MNVLFILTHPEPTSFNASLVRLGRQHFESNADQTEVVDLYGCGFDPVEHQRHYTDRVNRETFSPLAEQRHAYRISKLPADVEEQIAHLEWADLVIFQFPIWWHSVPAVLKGWFDRVFISGGLYSSERRYDRGHFRGKRALCSVTSGAPAEAFVAGGRGGELEQILWSTNFSLYYMGFDVLAPHASFGVAGHGYSYVSDDEFNAQFQKLEESWLRRLSTIQLDAPLKYPGWADWDDLGQPVNDAEKRPPL